VLLRVQELRHRKLPFDATFQADSIDLTETKYQPANEVRVAGMAELDSRTDEIRLSGHITSTLAGDCDRCLERVTLEFDRDFDLLYMATAAGSTEPEIELDDGETEIGYYEGDGLQLASVVTEQMLLWLPMQCICGEQCKGICPVCGANRNKISCDCHEKPIDERWAALRSFRDSART